MQSVKLCVTVRRALERKYAPASLQQIDRAVRDWIAAETRRGIRTVHVALDDANAMRAHGATAITGRVTANKVKKAIDKLWSRLGPDYLVLFGGTDIVPMFVVGNPSYDPRGDDDRQVPTDNPYACSGAFRSTRRASYLVPDRVVGRIPDMVGDGDPAWLTDYLATATGWTPRPAGDYADVYAICCDEWKQAGAECMRHIGAPPARQFISPPTKDGSTAARKRLSHRLHMIKCHGAQLDPKFYGQKGGNYPVAVASNTLKPRLQPATLAAAMCCYGAQIYPPTHPAAQDPGEWPMASTYLRKGALGFVGATMIAWVGVEPMMCADWIVAGYLKGVLGGASLGRALLESKQDYMRWINQQGQTPDNADEKTLIEFVLLGDPAIHPVRTSAAAPAAIGRRAVAALGPAPALALQERQQRRVVRAQIAGFIRELLPLHREATRAAHNRANDIFAAAKKLLSPHILAGVLQFGIKPAAVRVEKLETPLRSAALAFAGGPARVVAAAVKSRESLAYYWSGRRIRDGQKQIRMIKVETDPQGNVLRTAVMNSS